MERSYEQQAQDFLALYGLKCRITLSDSKPAPWGDDDKGTRHHYRVTISRPAASRTTARQSDTRLVFDFWGSIADAAADKSPTAYDVLACISGDAYTPDTFADFCADYGYDTDSIKALQCFRRADRFARRVRAFFSPEEIDALSEIQ